MNKKDTGILRNSLLNTIGLVLYFFVQWLTTVIAVRFGSFETAGIYAAIISFCNIFYYFSLFGIRNFQISDVDRQYSEGQYNGARLICALIAFLGCIAAVLFKKETWPIALSYLVYMGFKLSEAYTEGFFSILQLEQRYDKIFVSYLAKALVPAAAFALLLKGSGNLLTALAAMTAGYILAIIAVDLPFFRNRKTVRLTFRGVGEILRQCTPLFLISLTVPVMNYATRAAVESELGYYELGQYASLSSVIVVMSTMMGAVFLVLIPEISRSWKQRDRHRVLRYFGGVTVLMLLVGAVALMLGKLWGAPVCSLIFGKEILANIDLLVPLLISATVLMCKSFYSSMLVPLERRGLLLLGELTGMLVCVLTARPFTHHWGLQGVNYSYLLGLVIQLILLSTFAFATVVIPTKERTK